MRLLKFKKKPLNFLGLSLRRQKAIINKALTAANEEQLNVVKEYERTCREARMAS